jgi:hypothetical protein
MSCAEGIGCCNACQGMKTQIKWGAMHSVAGNLENSARLEIYEGQSLNRSQMDIKREKCDIRTRKKKTIFFVDTSSTNIDTFVPSIYEYQHSSLLTVVSAASVPSFDHLRFSNVLDGILDSAVNCFTRQTLPTVNRNISLRISFALSPIGHKNAQQNAPLRCNTPHARSPC